MANTILLKRSDVANSVPSTGNLVPGELALNFTDGNLFFKDASNNVVLLSSTKLVTVTGNVTGDNIIGNTSGQFGNITISGSNVNTTADFIKINSTSQDVDFSINGDAVANIFYVDAGVGTVSIGNSTQVANAVLSLNSTNSLVVPVGNISQRPDPAQVGMLRFNTEDDTVEFYTNAEGWRSATQQFTVIASETFTGSGYTKVFTLNSPQTTDSVIVSINGVVQIPGTAYTVSGTTLTFTAAPGPGYTIEVRSLTTTTSITQISNSPETAVVSVADAVGTVDITGNLIPTANELYDLGNTTARWRDLYLSGDSIVLGNIVIKNTAGNVIGFFGPDGTTPGTIDSTNIDSSSIANGTATVQTFSNANVAISAGGNANVGVFTGTGLVVIGSIEATNGFIGLDATAIANGTAEVRTFEDANVTVSAGGTANVLVVTGTGANISGTINATGNISGGNLVTAGLVSLSSIAKTGSNAVGNIGQSTNYFNTVFAQATSALYADVAENYLADAEYEPGTVVVFGGTAEVTMAECYADTRIAGVVTTNPAYVMNAGLTGKHVVAVALLGRVPCRVLGPISKGSMLVSAGDGYASACTEPKLGSVVGKALENFDGTEGVIEVVVGKI
jgi:hypothetical protein